MECPLCQKSIGKNYSLKRHIRVFHTEATVDEAEAETETEATTTEGKKKGQQPKLCDSCGAAFESLGSLMSHKKEVHQLELEGNEKIPFCSFRPSFSAQPDSRSLVWFSTYFQILISGFGPLCFTI